MPRARLPKAKKMLKLTRELLERAALNYVARYATTRAMLERTLLRRITNAARTNPELDTRQAQDWVQDIVNKHVAKGFVNDVQFSESLLRLGRSAGHSKQKILLKMKQKGLSRTQIAATFEAHESEEDGAVLDLKAAFLYVQKKKLGAFRMKGKGTPEELKKDMTRLCRAGFAPSIARKALREED